MWQGERPCVSLQRWTGCCWPGEGGLCALESLGRATLIKHDINKVTILRPVPITNKHLKITCLEHFYLSAFINNVIILYNNPGRLLSPVWRQVNSLNCDKANSQF